MSTILVIDEDRAMQALIGEWLQAAGYDCVAGPAGNDTPPAGVDLVLVDLPHLRAPGADALRTLRSTYPRAGLIGLSAQLCRSLPGHSAAARALGVRRLVAKPCARDELLAAVAEAIAGTGRPVPP